MTETGPVTKSHLVIRNARQSDEGNYTCKPSILQSASLRLFVIDGEIEINPSKDCSDFRQEFCLCSNYINV